MREDSYLVIDEKVLPEVYQKVVQANALLESGQAASTSEAVRMAGLSAACTINTVTPCSPTPGGTPPAF